MESVVVHWQGRLAWATAVASLYMAEAGLLAGLELVVQLVLVLVHVLREVRSQGQREWMRKIGVDHNSKEYETLPHFLLSCPTYAFKRWALERQVKKKKQNLTLEALLGDTDLALPLANYIDGTSRFKQSLSEQQYTQNHTTS